MGPTGGLETSLNDYQYSLREVPEESSRNDSQSSASHSGRFIVEERIAVHELSTQLTADVRFQTKGDLGV